MKIPDFLKKQFLKPLYKVAIESYKQGKEDFEKGEFNVKEYEKEVKKFIEREFKARM